MELHYTTQNKFDGVRIIATDEDGTLYQRNPIRKTLSGSYYFCADHVQWLATYVRRHFPHISIPLNYDSELVETLEMLKKRFGIIVVTDANRDVAYRKLKQLGAVSYIDGLIAYEDFGHPKDEEYYLRVLELTKLPPNAHVSVGDSLERDIRPSKKIA